MTHALGNSAVASMDKAFSGDSAGPVRVLVVEDEALVAMFLTDVLEDLHYEVCGVAASAADALTIAERERPALALVDINLAGAEDGIATACTLRERFSVGSIFMSGATDPELMERAERAQPHGFLHKPYDADQLKGALEAVFAPH